MEESKTTPTNPDNDTTATLESIHRLMQDAAETREKVGALRDQLKDVMEQNEEYRAIAEEIKELTKKRSDAKRALQEDKDYQVISADLDDYRLKLRDIQDILSQHLVLYYNQTQQTKIVDQGGETRSVILSAKVGKTEA
jgi:regulator of replication initiation timing